MKYRLTQVFAGVFALSAFSLLGCTSDTGGTPSGTGSGGSQGGALTASGGAGGTTTSAPGSGGAVTSGGVPASGGQTTSQGGTPAQGGSPTGGTSTSTGGQPSTGGSASGGRASGGVASGGSASGGSASGGTASGGSASGGSATGGAVTGGAGSGGKTATGGAATGGKTSTGGTATGGAETGGATATGGTSAGGSTGKITIWMSGDSTMSGSGCDGGGWGDQFGSLFKSDVTVQNLSVAGRSIQTWLYEKNVSSTAGANGECTLTATTYSANWNTMLTGMKAGDWLLVEFGINDGDGTCPRHVGTTLFQTYLTTMAKAATDRGANPIFLTSTSAIACNGATAQANRGFGPQTKAAGTADNVPVIDMTVLTAALYTSLGLCPNSNDYTSTTSKVGLFFCNDHTHFEAAGALQIAKTAAQALKDQSIPLAAYLLN
jgi:lysophospholipase L1-like esterase